MWIWTTPVEREVDAALERIQASVERFYAGVERAGRRPRPREAAVPLAVFLPARRKDYVFSWRGRGHEAGRETIVLDYRMRYDEAPTIEWEESCVPLPDGLLVRDATGLARLVPAD